MHNFCHSGAKSMLQRKGVLWENDSKTNFPGKPTHEIKSLTNMGFVISAENILSQPLCWRCINLDTAGRSHFYKENWEFCEKIFPKHTSQVSHMFTHTGEKPCKRRIVIVVENISSNLLLWRCTNFSTSGAKPSFLVGSSHRVSFAATEEAEMAEFSKTKKKGKVVEHTKICAVNI